MPVKEAKTVAPVESTQVVALTSKKGKKTESRVTLFSIDGKDYDIPAAIKPNDALRIMHVFRRQGDTSGISYMLEVLLGLEGYEALLNFDDLENDDLEKIIKIAFEMVAGATENPKV
jgi:hypothetical protein